MPQLCQGTKVPEVHSTRVYMCVSFTVCWSYSRIHTHLEIQIAKHSNQAWCKLQETQTKMESGCESSQTQSYPSQDETQFKTIKNAQEVQHFFKKKFLLQSPWCEKLSPVTVKSDFNSCTLKLPSCLRGVWTLIPVRPVSEKVLCLHWCHIVFCASFLKGCTHETDKPQDNLIQCYQRNCD